MAEKFDPSCHIGEVHGIYTIVDMTGEKDKYGHWIYKCVCNVCGCPKFSHYGKISGEKSKATHCNHLRANGTYIIKGKWKNSRIKYIFRDMMARCYNKKDKSYRWYGAKGVGVCEEWLNNPLLFEKWAADNGYKDTLTIDRINADQDYCPENCRWISPEDNSRRAGKVNWIEVDDVSLTGKQWAEKLNIGPNTINTAIREHGVSKTKELIVAMLKESPSTKYRKSHQTWFDAYGIQV